MATTGLAQLRRVAVPIAQAQMMAFAAPEGARGMATLRDIKSRIKSVTNISKITKSMKMVAASKLRAAQDKLTEARPFIAAERSVLDVYKETEKPNKKVLLVPITSDRGLCGGVNSSVGRAIKSEIRQNPEVDYEIFPVGDKAATLLSRELGNKINHSVKDIGKIPVNFTQACLIADAILKKEYDSVAIVYNSFRSAISQEITFERLYSLPSMAEDITTLTTRFEFEDDPGEDADLIKDVYEFHLASLVYNALVDNATSEQAARMSAMDNATRNAGDMISRLTLQYNRTRQAKITTELIEIISGAEAL